MDKLSDLAVKLKGKIKLQTNYNANFQYPSSRHLSVSNHRGYKIRVEDRVDLLSIEVKVESEFSFSVNRPDILFSYKMPVNLIYFPYTIYVRDESSSIFKDEPLIQSFLLSLSSILSRAEVSSNEGVFIYRNSIQFAMLATRNFDQVVDDIVDFIEENGTVFKEEIRNNLSLQKIPKILQPLLPLLKGYSISDDALREELVATLDDKQRKSLIDTVRPLIKEINNFLDSFGSSPLSEEAMNLGSLAELVSELMLNSEDC